jgi:hypothetical protein
MLAIDKKYLPSKKFVQALSAAIILVLMGIILSYWRPNFGSYKNTALTVNATSTWMNNNIDSDNDGLPDWEETLYGTDPHNIDTNGDGTPDGVEVKEGRDPLTPNTAPIGQKVNNYVPASVIAANQAQIQAYQALAPTDKMAQDLMSNILASEPADGSGIDQDTTNSIVNSAIQDLPQENFTGTTTAADLNIIPVNPNQTIFMQNLTTYASIYYTQTENFRKIMGDDLQIINATTTDPNVQKKEMAQITLQYRKIINALIAAPIPAVASSSGMIYDLEIINDLEALSTIDTDMVSTTDKAVVFSDLTLYNSTINDLVNALGVVDYALNIERQ